MAAEDNLTSTIIKDIRTAASLTASGRVLTSDTETTGLLVEDGHRIVGIALVEMIDLRRTGREIRFRINPEQPIDPDATAIHGITDADVADCPIFRDIIPDLEDFIGGAALAFHNAPFDLAFIEEEYRRAGLAFPGFTAIDTLPIARARWPGRQASLDAISVRIGVDLSGRTTAGGLHDELVDSRILADVLQWLCQERLGDLFAAQADADALSTQGLSDQAPSPRPAATLRTGRKPAPHPPLTAEEKVLFANMRGRIAKAAKNGPPLWDNFLGPSDQ